MARLASQEKMGYYPTPPSLLPFMASYLKAQGPASVLDPCAGEGEAVSFIAKHLGAKSYAVELDRTRGTKANGLCDFTLIADAFRTRISDRAFSVLFLNPAYDWEVRTEGEKAQRIEAQFLGRFTPKLVDEGVLIYIIPFYVLRHEARYLARHYEKINVYRFPREEDPAENFQGLLRRPYPAQAHTARAIYKALQLLPSVYLVGEMGTGKTMISISMVHLFPTPQRVLIMAPSHLVSKWEREVKDTITGAKIMVLRELRTLLAMRERKQEKPTTHEFYILSKERAKLHHGWKVAFLKRPKSYVQCPKSESIGPRTLDLGHLFVCSDCGKEIENPKLDKKQKCPHCKSTLWQAVVPKRYAFAEFIKKYLNKGYFDLLVADECQKYKGATAQGLALAELVSSVSKTILLTGTLMGGYAHNLFNLLWRSHTQEMKERGFSHASETRFQHDYGFIERTYREVIGEEKDYPWSRAKRRSVNVKPIPGINPLILPHFLLPNAVFLRLSDVAEALPPYEERVVSLAMNPGQANEYWEVEAELKEIVKQCLIQGSKRALAPYLQGLLMLPDAIYRQNEITADGVVIDNSPVEGIMPKEAELLEIVKKEKAQGRKVLVYINYTDTRDITPRLQRFLEEKGYRVGILRSGEAERREEILGGLVKKGVDVVITNPALVETGLDLYDFPSVVFYETGYSIYLLRQSVALGE